VLIAECLQDVERLSYFDLRTPRGGGECDTPMYRVWRNDALWRVGCVLEGGEQGRPPHWDALLPAEELWAFVSDLLQSHITGEQLQQQYAMLKEEGHVGGPAPPTDYECACGACLMHALHSYRSLHA
jgi:hypothetical protein